MPWLAANPCSAFTPPSTVKEVCSVSSIEVPTRLMPTAQPLLHAEALLKHLTELAHATSSDRLLAGLVQAAAQLSGCELSQLYLLDDTHTRLWLCAEWHEIGRAHV